MIKDYFKLPINSTWVSVGFKSNHTAVDLGWTKEAGPNQPIYPIAEGKVVETGWYKDGGNIVWVQHEDDKNRWFSGYMHMASPAKVRVGQEVNRSTMLGIMGNTGESFGEHVHLVLVRAPKGTAWSNSGTRKYRVNPLDHVYRFPGQLVKTSYDGKSKLIKDKPSTPYNKPASKEIAENGQITVTVDVGLRVRKTPTLKGDVVKVLPKGTKKVYTHYVDADGIRWVKLKEGGYAARRTLDNKTIYANAEFLKGSAPSKPAPSKPKPKPSKIGKYANVSRPTVRLFIKSRGDECYKGKAGVFTKNYQSAVRPFSGKILKEDNGRVLVSMPKHRFDTDVWIANSETTSVTNSPVHK